MAAFVEIWAVPEAVPEAVDSLLTLWRNPRLCQ
jgi:hypothetical protein